MFAGVRLGIRDLVRIVLAAAFVLMAGEARARHFMELEGLDGFSVEVRVNRSETYGGGRCPVNEAAVETGLQSLFATTPIKVITQKERQAHAKDLVADRPQAAHEAFEISEMPFRFKYMPTLKLHAFVFTNPKGCEGFFQASFEMWVRQGKLYPQNKTYTGPVKVWGLKSWGKSEPGRIQDVFMRFMNDTAQRFADHWSQSNPGGKPVRKSGPGNP